MEISYLTIGGQVGATQGFRLPSLVSRPGRPRIVEPTHARIAQMVVDPTAWSSAGTMPVRRRSGTRAELSSDPAGAMSPIPSFRPEWDHTPVVRRCSTTPSRLQGRDSQTNGIHGLRVSRPRTRTPFAGLLRHERDG